MYSYRLDHNEVYFKTINFAGIFSKYSIFLFVINSNVLVLSIVSKTIFTKGGDVYTKIIVSYENISGSSMLFSSFGKEERREGGMFYQPPLYKGPPGPNGSYSINIKPISSIEDIIKLTTI